MVVPFLADGAIFSLLVRLVLGAIASALAILAWTRTRNLSWILVIAGILAAYAGTLYGALRIFGFLSGTEILIYGAPLGSLISDNLSILFFIAAFVFFLRKS
jgi:hypothetical protein